MNILIQHACGPMADCLLAVLGHHERYAKRHDMVYGWTTEPGDVWTRFSLLAEALASRKSGELVFWLDADAVVVNPERDLSDALGPDDVAGAGVMPGEWIHTGVLYLRAVPSVEAWMRRCWAARTSDTGLDGFPVLAVARVFNEQRNGVPVKRLGRHWNEWTGAKGSGTENTVVRAFHALPRDNKLAAIKRTLQAVA